MDDKSWFLIIKTQREYFSEEYEYKYEYLSFQWSEY